MTSNIFKISGIILIFSAFFMLPGCGKRDRITKLQQLDGKEFAVPTGNAADKLVLSKLPNAKFKYFNSVIDASMAVKAGKADAVAYDEPILKNIAAKNSGLTVLPEMITNDNYAFAVQIENQALKRNVDLVVNELRKTGIYDDMRRRWLPKTGNPAAMPDIRSSGSKGILKLGTAAITEPFSFMDASQNIIGFDIEIARRVAQKLDMNLEVIDMEFGSLIPALLADKVDMIAACITVTDERAKKILFSETYYTGGIAALVKE